MTRRALFHVKRNSAVYWWLWNWRYRLLHPREWLCDAGVWKCDHHPRLLHLAEDRRWAWKHKLRARRVRSWSGWQPGELARLMGPSRQEAERAALYATLAADLRLLAQRRRDAVITALLDECAANGVVFAPWQAELVRQHLQAKGAER